MAVEWKTFSAQDGFFKGKGPPHEDEAVPEGYRMLLLNVQIVACVNQVPILDLGVEKHKLLYGGLVCLGDPAQCITALDLIDDASGLFGGLFVTTVYVVQGFHVQFH